MSSGLAKQLNAYWTLGTALIKHTLALPFVGRKVPGPWLRSLARESLGTVPAGAWQRFAGASRCTGCGLCDSVGGSGDRLSEWMLSLARQPSDALAAIPFVERIERAAEEIERICPSRVRVRDFTDLVRQNAGMLDKY